MILGLSLILKSQETLLVRFSIVIRVRVLLPQNFRQNNDGNGSRETFIPSIHWVRWWELRAVTGTTTTSDPLLVIGATLRRIRSFLLKAIITILLFGGQKDENAGMFFNWCFR